MVILSRQLPAEGICPATGPIATASVLLDPLVVGAEHVGVASRLCQLIEHYRELRDVIALLGVEGLGREKRLLAGRSRGLQRILNQPLFVVAIYTAMEGRSAPIADTLAGCSATREAECDDWDEASLYTAS